VAIFERRGAGERLGDPRQVPEPRHAAGKAAAEAGLEERLAAERLAAERRACAEPNGCSGSPEADNFGREQAVDDPVRLPEVADGVADRHIKEGERAEEVSNII